MDFKELLRMARRRWVTIVVFLLIALIGAGAISALQTRKYESTARIFISNEVTSTNDAYAASLFSAGRVQSYADLANSRELMQLVVAQLDLQISPQQLGQQVSASVANGTVIIELRVADTDPARAQKIAAVTSEALTVYLDELETPVGKSNSPVKATVVDPASYNGAPIAPRTALNLVVAGLLGLLVGLGVAVLRDLLDTSIKSREEAEAAVGGPVMAAVAFDNELAKMDGAQRMSSHSGRAEAFRILRTNLQFLDPDHTPEMFVITSAVPGEGKTSTSTSLAVALAQAGQRVLLVDGDLRKPRIADTFGIEGSVGFTTVLVGRTTLEESIQIHAETGVHILASGPVPPNPTEILQARATGELLDSLRERFDVVVIDAPPLLPVADAAILATKSDGAIVVVRHGKTSRDQLREAVRQLDAVGARTFGAVVNMMPKRNMQGYGYGYGYGYAPETTRNLSLRNVSKESADDASVGSNVGV